MTLAKLKSELSEKSPKEMRTLRNQLNNRITSFKKELDYGSSIPKLSPSHALFDLSYKDCLELLELAKKELKNAKKID
jgi:hypothetical protein